MKLETQLDTATGRFWQPSPARNPYDRLSQRLETPVTVNSPDQKPQVTTSGRMTPESREPSLNLEQDPSNEMTPRTGTPSGNLQHAVTSYPFQPMYVFSITGLCEASALTLQNRLLWSELVMYSLVQLALVSQGQLGREQVWTLTLKIPTQNSGAVTAANQVLSSMNFVVESMSRTYYAGSIAIRATWKSKDQVSHFVMNPFSSHPTWNWINGIQI